MFRTLFSLILLFSAFSTSAAIIEIRRGGGDSLVAEATNAIGNFNGTGTNTTLVGNTVVTGNPDFRGNVDASALTITNTATFLGSGVAENWLFNDTVTTIGLITALGGVDASGQTIVATTFNGTTINATTLNVPSAFTNANTLFVHKGGSDSAGLRGSASKYAFLTLTGAQAKAQSGDTIIVYPGTYTQHALGKDGVDWNFQPGVILDPGTNLFVFSQTNVGALSFNVYGSADVTNGFLELTNGNIYAEVLNIRAPKDVFAVHVKDDSTATATIRVKNQVMGRVQCVAGNLDLYADEYYLTRVSLANNLSTIPVRSKIQGKRFIRSTLVHDGDAANCSHKTDIIFDYVKGPNIGDWDISEHNGFALNISDGTAHVRGGYFVSGSSGNLILFDAAPAGASLGPSSTLEGLTLIQTNGMSNVVNNSGGTAALNLRGTVVGNTVFQTNFNLSFSAGEFWYNPFIITSWEQ